MRYIVWSVYGKTEERSTCGWEYIVSTSKLYNGRSKEKSLRPSVRGIILNMDRDTFTELVLEALDDLPEQFREKLQNVEITVEDWPDAETMRLARVRNRSSLLGFYHGIPLPERTQGYNMVMPDKISIYRQPILMHSRNRRQVRERVSRVLRHEVAHYFGIDDERLREIGAY